MKPENADYYFKGATKLLGDSQKYMPPILPPFSAKRIATQILVAAKNKWEKKNYFESFCLRSHSS